MKTYISILRGINVSGKNSIKMDSLASMYKAMGFGNVTTYIQSGNVIFTAAETNNDSLALALSHEILTTFGFEVPVIVLEINELSRILDENPFRSGKDEKLLHFTFLSETPKPYDMTKITSKVTGEEEIVLNDKVVYLYCPHGYGKTKLTNTFLESSLKVTATTRNFKTANEILKIAEQIR